MTGRREIRTEGAPTPIGPYSQAVAWGDLVFCSGQVALDPITGGLLGDGDAAREAEAACANLLAVLAAAGSGPEHVLKTTLYLVDMADFGAVNAVYGRVLGASGECPAPARATVAVSALPRGARVEIDAVAVRVRAPQGGRMATPGASARP
jgi:reactive intermediate/imine deaminase